MPSSQIVDLKIVYSGTKGKSDTFRNVRVDASDQEIYDTARAIINLVDFSQYTGCDILKIESKELSSN